jgi:DNA uptake protein ComE-like DNA-binding protein
MLSRFIKDYLRFSRRDRIGVFFLIFLISIIYFLPLLFPRARPFPLSSQPVLAEAVDSLLAHPEETATTSHPSTSGTGTGPSPSFTPAHLFRFDPNTLSAEGWKALGLTDRSIRTLLHYRDKGGHFYHPSDLQKIWGLPPGFYDHVKDSIILATTAAPANSFNTNKTFEKFEKKQRKIEPIGINTSDTTTFIALPGIGNKLAARIVAFRDRLGGFYSIAQVSEVYGLPDSTFQKIKPFLLLDGAVKKININTATKDELKMHPYLRWKLANILVEYRNAHGPFKSPTDLKNILLLDDPTLQKILPYLTFN